MVQHLKTEIAKGGKIYEAKRHDKHPDHFTVYLGQSDGTRKVFVNVLESTLMDELAEAGQLDDFGRIVFPGTFTQALDANYKISEYHLDSPNSASVTLSKENCIDIYLPEVSLEYLADALMVDKDTLLLTSKEHLKFEDAIEQGYQLIQFHRHDPTNPNSHYVAQLLKNSRIKTFGNVSSTLIEQIYGDECLDSWITTEKEFLNVLEKYKPRGLDFETCVKIGGRIVKSSETSKGRVTVKFMIGDLVKG